MLKRRPHKDARDTSYNVVAADGVTVKRAWTLPPHKGLCIAWSGDKDTCLVLLHLGSGQCPLTKVQFPMTKGAGTHPIDIEVHPLTIAAMQRVLHEVADLIDWAGTEVTKAHLALLPTVDQIAVKHIVPLLPLPVAPDKSDAPEVFLLRRK